MTSNHFRTSLLQVACLSKGRPKGQEEGCEEGPATRQQSRIGLSNQSKDNEALVELEADEALFWAQLLGIFQFIER